MRRLVFDQSFSSPPRFRIQRGWSERYKGQWTKDKRKSLCLILAVKIVKPVDNFKCYMITGIYDRVLKDSVYGPMSPGCSSGGQICPSNEIVKQVF